MIQRWEWTYANNTQLLIRDAREGNREAFDELVKRYESSIELLIRGETGAHLRGQVEVADLLQETFSSAFQSMRQFRGQERETFARWLSKIARNVVRGCARRMAKQNGFQCDPLQGAQSDTHGKQRDIESSAGTPSEDLRCRERFDRLRRAMEMLSADHRRVIILARVRELPMREVARIMERTPEAAGMLLVRALMKLKTHFGPTESLELPRDMTIDESGGVLE